MVYTQRMDARDPSSKREGDAVDPSPSRPPEAPVEPVRSPRFAGALWRTDPKVALGWSVAVWLGMIGAAWLRGFVEGMLWSSFEEGGSYASNTEIVEVFVVTGTMILACCALLALLFHGLALAGGVRVLATPGHGAKERLWAVVGVLAVVVPGFLLWRMRGLLSGLLSWLLAA